MAMILLYHIFSIKSTQFKVPPHKDRKFLVGAAKPVFWVRQYVSGLRLIPNKKEMTAAAKHDYRHRY